MIEKLKDELYQLENKQAKGANFVLTLGRSWRSKMLQNFLQIT